MNPEGKMNQTTIVNNLYEIIESAPLDEATANKGIPYSGHDCGPIWDRGWHRYTLFVVLRINMHRDIHDLIDLIQ